MVKRRFVPITRKVNAIILACLICGVGGLSFYFSSSISDTITTTTRDNLKRQSDILYKSIENFMLPGEAPLAVRYFEDVAGITPDFTIRLFRTTGLKAFGDNATLNDVNARLGRQRFAPRPPERIAPEQRARVDLLKLLGSPPRNRFVEEEDQAGSFFRIYKPLLNLPKCTPCHGPNHTIRGIIEIRSDISASVAAQRTSLAVAGVIFLAVVALLGLALSQFLHRAVLAPVRRIGEACSAVTGGDFEVKVSLRNNDEIGALGETVNRMVEGLHERFKLSKYVSGSTLRSLKDERSARTLRLAILFSDIRGFTAYSEKRRPEAVVEVLNRVLNIQTEIIHSRGGDIDKYVGDEIVALFHQAEGEKAACAAALDIVEAIAAAGDLDGLRVGLGINSGEVILGMIGSQRRADFTVIGDNVNLASRLCSNAKPGQIIISDSVMRAAGGAAAVEGPYRIKLKGKYDYQRVYVLTGLKDLGGPA